MVRGDKNHLNISILVGLSWDQGRGHKVVHVTFSGPSLAVKRKTQTESPKIPGQSLRKFVYVFFCSVFFPNSIKIGVSWVPTNQSVEEKDRCKDVSHPTSEQFLPLKGRCLPIPFRNTDSIASQGLQKKANSKNISKRRTPPKPFFAFRCVKDDSSERNFWAIFPNVVEK